MIILIFSRALQALPVNIDPIPKDITQDFKLLTLHDVSLYFQLFHNAYLFIHKRYRGHSLL